MGVLSGDCEALCSASSKRVTMWHIQFHALQLSRGVLQCVAVCCSVLQCVAVRCSVLQCVACGISNSMPPSYLEVCCGVLQCVAVCCMWQIQFHALQLSRGGFWLCVRVCVCVRVCAFVCVCVCVSESKCVCVCV